MVYWIRHYVAEVCNLPSALLVINVMSKLNHSYQFHFVLLDCDVELSIDRPNYCIITIMYYCDSYSFASPASACSVLWSGNK